MSEDNSHRQILRSTSIIGGASVLNIMISLLRTKLVAVLLGPAGVGLIGLLQTLMDTASTMSSLGFSPVGTRQIADAIGRDDPLALAVARRALFWATLGLAAIGAAVFWLLRGVLAKEILGNSGFSNIVGWLTIGVVLTVASGSQGALLRGLRHIGDIARVSILSALLSTVVGIGALWLWSGKGIVVFVLSVPVASFLLGHWFVSQLPLPVVQPTPWPRLVDQWKTLARLGLALMVAELAVVVGQLVVRTMVQRELGAAALGHFQAAWLISMTYLGFVLQAMVTDYYPRLTSAFRNHAVANRLVNEQSEVALLLAGPVFLVMLALAPWVIELLYSSKFAEAAIVLRWQILGDILKVASWPLGFVILAAGDGRAFILTESLALAMFIALTWLGLPLVGIEATGIAFVGMYMGYLPIVYWIARRKTGFIWERRVFMQLIILIALALVVFLTAIWSKWLGAVLGLVAAGTLSLHGLARLDHLANFRGSLGQLAAFSRWALIKAGVWRD